MSSGKEPLYVIAEKQYANTTWYNCVMEGLVSEAAKRRLKIVKIESGDLPRLEKDAILVLLGSSFLFISGTVNHCLKRGLRPIVAGFEVIGDNAGISYVTINRRRAMAENVRSLVSCGAARIALFGVNSAIRTDMLRYEGWRDTVRFYRVGDPDADVYYSDQGIEKALAAMLKNHASYDAVACANDYCAVSLLSALRGRGVRVPEELMITGFGNIHLGQYTDPPLTTVALRLDEVGKQVVRLQRNLTKNPGLLSASVTINFEMVIRQSTKAAYKDIDHSVSFVREIQSAFEPTYEQGVKEIYLLENAVCGMDEIDRKILKGILDGMPYPALSESLYLSETTLRYRVNKLFAMTETPNKAALKRLLKNYIPFFSSYGGE